MLTNRSLIMYFVLLLAVPPLAGSAQVNRRLPLSPSQIIPPTSYETDEDPNIEGRGTSGMSGFRSQRAQNSGDGHRHFDGSPRLRHDRIDPDEVLNTIPYWADSFDYHGLTYKYSMVGSDPRRGSKTTVIPTELIPLRFVFADGSVFDASTDIIAGQTAIQGIKNSPMFQNYDFVVGGTNVGNTQYGDAFQRANFWDSVSTRSPDYHVLLGQPTILPVQTIIVPADKGSYYFDSNSGLTVPLVNADFLQAQNDALFTFLNISPRSLPIFVWGRVWGESSRGGPGNPGAAAWHGSKKTGRNAQTYIGTSYSRGEFGYFQDVDSLSHEVLEWLDDPFTNNFTPGWIYPFLDPIERCDSGFVLDLLEVGDPFEIFSESIVALPGPSSTYHVVEGMFIDFYTRRNHSRSVNGQYSLFEIGSPYGLLTGPSLPCTGHVEPDKTYIEYPGGVSTRAYGINNRGSVVGYYRDTNGQDHGYLLDRSGYSPLNYPGATGTYPLKINDRNDIVGYFTETDGLPHGFLYKNRRWTRIDFPGSTDTVVLGINSNGDLVGEYDNAQVISPSFILKNGHYQSFETPFALNQAQASGINDSGEIVGAAFDDPNNGPFHGFKRLGNHVSPYNFPAANSTLPFSINNLGDIAGFFSNSDGNFHGFVTVYGRPYEVYLSTYDNNDLGQIVGAANIGTAEASHIVGYVGKLPLAHDDH